MLDKFDIAFVTGVTTFLGSLVSILSPVFFQCYEIKTLSKPKKRVLYFLIPLTWLWFPWVAYAVYSLGSVNRATIHHLEQPDKIIPKDANVIDLNE